MNPTGRIISKLRGLSHTWRWNYHPRVRQESVAEHSYWVTAITHQLMVMRNDNITDIGKALVLALYHDAEEAVTGDLPAPVKRGRSWSDVKTAAMIEIFGNTSITDGFNSTYYYVVKQADIIASLIFADEEIKLGNTHFKMIRDELLMTAKKIDDPCVNKLLCELGFTTVDMSHL